MKSNPCKYHLTLSPNVSTITQVTDSLMKNNNCEKLLAVKIDCDLIFDNPIKDHWF